MRSGAVGINLTQANYLFIPALEAQAIVRVHRLGQTRPVQITRLLMKNSVETRMRKIPDEKYGSTPVSTIANVDSLVFGKVKILREEFDNLFELAAVHDLP
jgi:SNF2 family DNA or RNA helicase